ncbi:hypothetical protein JZO77_16715 [Enterococcus hulanensis]|uniref:hypothetical protein n=1 Tax=Enterococcus hulanensis TaxID=2559929 RepID=UPI001A8C0D23|nr:hypothetical protein [Enterococcus hulanensis]MBO0458376.1 hypothetical protein [Enterococcus hulanensis]
MSQKWTWQKTLKYLEIHTSEIENEMLVPKNKKIGDSELVEVIPLKEVHSLLYRLSKGEIEIEEPK